MRLHEYKDDFATLIENIYERTEISRDILEKDYYVTLMLYELSKKQDTNPAYFKGGTSLYKALKSVRRFSEDIDITVDISECSKKQARDRLKDVANEYTSLPRTTKPELLNDERNRGNFIIRMYDYDSLYPIQKDRLQRYGNVKIEANSFSISEPTEKLEVEPLLYTLANNQERELLRDKFNVRPFNINTITMERTFIDKVFASELYYQNDRFFDGSKHLYDIAILFNHPRIEKLLNDKGKTEQLIALKRKEETSLGRKLGELSFDEFTLFSNPSKNKELKRAFQDMQDIYVFNTNDLIQFDDMVEIVKQVHQGFIELEA